MTPLPHMLAIGCAIIYLSITSLAAADDHSSAQLASTCAACHRLDRLATDNQTNGIPPITGLEADMLADMMRAFKLNTQTDHIMHTVSLTLSDKEIVDVASYLADLGKAK